MKSCEGSAPWLVAAPHIMSRPDVQDGGGGCDADPKLGSRANSSPGSPFSRSHGEGLTSSCDDSEDSLNTGPDSNPLVQLQTALEKSGLLGVQLGDVDRRVQPQEFYRCHLCAYQGTSQLQYSAHMSSHFDHKCPFCDYTSRTEGRLKRHVKDFHSEVPPESWAGTRVPLTDDGSADTPKDRKFRCKQCGHVADSKNDFWEHSKVHIRTEKLLTCPKCPFVTEYKHHLEYHLRNHFGSKPFKCGKCNYSCVNKSMLNSHMKSHSNVYQYRCADCNYATKYCHSLKLHLRKYLHKPATVLNMDGSPNPYPIVDVYGSRRGPRPRKKFQQVVATEDSNAAFPTLPSIQGHQSFAPSQLPQMMPVNPVGFAYPPYLMNGYRAAMMMGAQVMDNMTFQQQDKAPLQSERQAAFPPPRPLPWKEEESWKCNLCGFAATDREVFNQHVMQHTATENQFRAPNNNQEGAAGNVLATKVEEVVPCNGGGSPNPMQAAVDVSFVSSTSNLEMPVQNQKDEGKTPPGAEAADRNGIETPLPESAENPETETKAVAPSGRSRSFPLDLSRPVDLLEGLNATPPVRHRRKGRAVRLDRICMKLQEERGSSTLETADECENELKTPPLGEKADGSGEPPEPGTVLPSAVQRQSPEANLCDTPVQDAGKQEDSSDSNTPKNDYRCVYCDIVFKHCVMYTVHMGYHGYHDPFTCNMCGQQNEDKVAFFLHIARAAHL